MKIVYIILICVMAITGIFSLYFSNGNFPPTPPPSEIVSHTFTVSTTDVQRYGLYCPLTFVFSIPQQTMSLDAYYKYETSMWTRLPEKDSDDFFNGIECVRFDYVNDKAYVSAAFKGHAKLYIGIAGEDAELCEYLNMAQYYDDRWAVVTSTHDDWCRTNEPDFREAINAFQKYRVWFTAGIIAGWGGSSADWAKLQNQIDEGYVDVASHSVTHFYLPDGSRDPNPNQHYEAGKSRDFILGNLTRLPYGPYVPVWIEPFGDAWWPQTLPQYNYLFSRSTTTSQTGMAVWSSSIGMYNRYGCSIEMGSYGITNLATLNGRFDQAYNGRGVYHVMSHPYQSQIDWSSGSWADLHLQHISGRLDVWYVGMSGLYQYHYAKMKVQYFPES